MVDLSSVVAQLDSRIAAALGIANVFAFGLAETVRTKEETFPANGEEPCGYSDTYALTYYHRALGGSVGTDTESGEGRQVYQQERWEMTMVVFADRTRLEGMRPDEIYRRFASVFPIFDPTPPFNGPEISGGQASIVRFNLDRNSVVASEFGGQNDKYGPEIIAIRIDYALLLELTPACVTLPCIGRKRC